MDNKNPRPGNYDRSWNDPPLFSYASGTHNSTDVNKQGTNRLNKRVEFPSLSNNSNVIPGALPPTKNEGFQNTPPYTHSTAISNGPIPPPMVPPMNLDGMSSKPLQVLPYDYKNTSNPNKSHANCDYKETENNLSSSNMEIVITDLNQVLVNAQSEINLKKLSDIKKRVSTLETKWKSGMLNAETQNGMLKIAKCLLGSQVSTLRFLCEQFGQPREKEGETVITYFEIFLNPNNIL